MRKLVVSVVTLAMCSVASQAALTVLESFDDLTVGTIDMQHVINEYGIDVELWNAQANTSLRRDSGWSNVVADGGNDNSQCLELINRDQGGEVDTVYTTVYLGYDNQITDKGTVYLQYKATDANDLMMCFNDNMNGYLSDVDGGELGEEYDYQGTTNYSDQSTIVRLAANQNFRARADGSYLETDMGQTAGTWYELWVQFDVGNKTSRFYICEAGGTPTAVINPNTSGEWWGWRDDSDASVLNISWKFGGISPFNYEVVANIDTIAISKDWDLDSFWVEPQPALDGDLDGDCDVDIFDFLVLKANYGVESGATYAMGDIDGDGDVDIFDFLVLKANYGSTCE